MVASAHLGVGRPVAASACRRVGGRAVWRTHIRHIRHVRHIMSGRLDREDGTTTFARRRAREDGTTTFARRRAQTRHTRRPGRNDDVHAQTRAAPAAVCLTYRRRVVRAGVHRVEIDGARLRVDGGRVAALGRGEAGRGIDREGLLEVHRVEVDDARLRVDGGRVAALRRGEAGRGGVLVGGRRARERVERLARVRRAGRAHLAVHGRDVRAVRRREVGVNERRVVRAAATKVEDGPLVRRVREAVHLDDRRNLDHRGGRRSRGEEAKARGGAERL